jgi:hypothetical protein
MTSPTTRKLARKLNRPPASTRNAPTGPWVVGSVTAVSISTASLTATIHGDTVAIAGINYLDSYTPVVGDNVILIRNGAHLWAIGTVAAYTGGSGSGWNTPALFSDVVTGSGSTQPAMWRIVGDNGSLKVQLKGGVVLSSGYGNFWTFGPTGAACPAYNRLVPIVGPSGIYTYLVVATATGNVSLPAGVTTTGSVSLDGVEYFIN